MNYAYEAIIFLCQAVFRSRGEGIDREDRIPEVKKLQENHGKDFQTGFEKDYRRLSKASQYLKGDPAEYFAIRTAPFSRSGDLGYSHFQIIYDPKPTLDGP